jgi:mono/diheme cytochrome c family protein
MALNRLPRYRHPVLETERFGRATSDGFFLSIEAADPKFDENRTVDELAALDAAEIEPAHDRTTAARIPRLVWWGAAILIALAVLPPLLIARARVVKSNKPRIHIVQDMDFQPKYKTQAYSAFFKDHRTMRLPCPGTVAQGELEVSSHYNEGKIDGEWAKTFPIPVTDRLMQRGRERFDIYCAACHGLVGDAEGGMTAIKAAERGEPGWVPPLSLHGADIRKQPVGQIFGTITNGIRTMPSYAAQIPVEDRWAIILYVRALQLSQDAPLKDVPKDKRDELR